MKKQSLTGSWQLQVGGQTPMTGTIPGSVYSILLENNQMEDPFYRDNELDALKIMENNFTFARVFSLSAEIQQMPKILLRCEGLDTLCTLRLNGVEIGKAENMFRTWEWDVTSLLRSEDNVLEIAIDSPTRAIRERNQERYFGGSWDAMDGFSHLRKAHCMFGWDWGPRLPDAGIWRDICLLGIDGPRITDVRIHQEHQDNAVSLAFHLKAEGHPDWKITIKDPNGNVFYPNAKDVFTVPHPQLWWPNGLGAQPLYNVKVEALHNGQVTDVWEKRIGLRTLTVLREKDQWGESFSQCVNGVSFFAMGANFIPQDNILNRITPEKTKWMLEQCVAAHFNVIRVWGGGYYPEDYFYDYCDALGLVVWQDFMFACANYPLDFAFEENITAEFIDNIRRLRHHASLGLWCGNNEMEMFQMEGIFNSSEVTRALYIRMFEHILPHVLRKEDPDTFYWPASPSSGGSFVEPNAPDIGDVHYWDVWHGEKPFSEYRKFFFRYASEFGFQSFPCLKTVDAFTLPEDRNVFSYVMEMHQRNQNANAKIMGYMGKTFLYPTCFEVLLYASQLLQAEAIRYGVEHWRRNRGRCMGAIYWQFNDIWPVASWASIDYYGRWKALHYYAKRFFAPVMVSCEETGEHTCRASVVAEPSPIETTALLNVTNETPNTFTGVVHWTLCNAHSEILQEGRFDVTVPAFEALWLPKLDFDQTDYFQNHLSYTLESNGDTISAGSVLFTAPKHYRFADPALQADVQGDTIVVTAAAFAKSVEIYSNTSDFILSDNFFDMEKGRKEIQITEGMSKDIQVRSVYNIK